MERIFLIYNYLSKEAFKAMSDFFYSLRIIQKCHTYRLQYKNILDVRSFAAKLTFFVEYHRKTVMHFKCFFLNFKWTIVNYLFPERIVKTSFNWTPASQNMNLFSRLLSTWYMHVKICLELILIVLFINGYYPHWSM